MTRKVIRSRAKDLAEVLQPLRSFRMTPSVNFAFFILNFEFTVKTYTFDASKESLGRMASRIAVMLMGKDKPSFERHTKAPICIIITNSDKLILTGKKWQNKKYRRHSGYIGHLKETTAEQLKAADSRRIIRFAVSGMLPKNKLRARMLKNLLIYKGQNPG